MREVDAQTFSDMVPGSPPIAADREKFLKPNFTKKNMSEYAIGIQLTKTIKSVFQTAASDGMRVLHSPPHKVSGCLYQMSDAFNRVGIYLDNETARRATTLSAADGAKKLTREQVESGDFGRHSWHWIAVLGVVKGFHNPECAFDMGRAPSMSSDFIFEEDSDWLDSDDDAEGVQPPSVPNALLDSMDDEDGSSDTSSDDGDSEPCTGRAGTKESAVSELADFMYNLATRQHRTFTYGFYVQWRRARLLYFDRTGILVSESFDWTKPTSPLHDFVWKLAHMTPTELGYDPTAQQASFEDMVKVYQKAMDPLLSEAIRGYINSAFFSTTEQSDLDQFPIYKLTVPTPHSSPEEEFLDSERRLLPAAAQESQRAFLVGRPHFTAEDLIGQIRAATSPSTSRRSDSAS
ncbi:hypothetical protein GSI_12452 [Ganoderma sinense ZZ0214-1]|uniref:Fungal-type protein kinase domain-containing protein n=1 Tax=Ganoderma sinense ZZ0214-1 TaxID=1077348 RepID=A0A2G8RT87_9APHY|nr:hypothetical protein GSI_12452 [Ganoderma sinense ZZ0214-1]